MVTNLKQCHYKRVNKVFLMVMDKVTKMTILQFIGRQLHFRQRLSMLLEGGELTLSIKTMQLTNRILKVVMLNFAY